MIPVSDFLTIFYIYFPGLPTYGQAACKPTSEAAADNYSVPIGKRWSICLNLTDADQQADYIYLKNGNGTRLMKLRKGETGNGTCYNEASGCQKYYSLSHFGKGVIEVIIRVLSKSMQGPYELYSYCKWTDHNCNRGGPIKAFSLFIEDEQNLTERTKGSNTTSEDIPSVKGCAMNIWLGKLTFLPIVPVLWQFF